ncbi:unnamed protein product [Caenorhabditis auriculariae]|uniref:Uncharacterized protein n=1 Tax=Caenorhabditis auriculariae TaxID=2777116 RepID=A0A8S1HWN4_9PELO|nr:unnamed protein product [Caenorhabditis auriculariae]
MNLTRISLDSRTECHEMAKMSAERRSLRRRIAVSTVLVFAVVGSFFFVLFAGSVSVMSNGLACSLGLLFAMLIVLLACIALSRWRMDKLFGLLMIFSYAGFCMLCILLETGHIKCPLRNTC